MAEKDSSRYLYEQYGTKTQNNGTTTSMMTTTAGTLLKKVDPPSSLKATSGSAGGKGQHGCEGAIEEGAGGGRKRRCCSCMSPKAASFWIAMLTNLGICTLLLSYTLLGNYNQSEINLIKYYNCS